ncbi:MAG: hypothetical protein QNJ30_20060 [Kiloniellales bacterium]|nr:hypothetical protein [Kiloniellales bacterium]
MTEVTKLSLGRKAPASTGSPDPALQAERDYYDCLARFGHASAEAHVAEMLWRRLRSRAAQSGSR